MPYFAFASVAWRPEHILRYNKIVPFVFCLFFTTENALLSPHSYPFLNLMKPIKKHSTLRETVPVAG